MLNKIRDTNLNKKLCSGNAMQMFPSINGNKNFFIETVGCRRQTIYSKPANVICAKTSKFYEDASNAGGPNELHKDLKISNVEVLFD